MQHLFRIVLVVWLLVPGVSLALSKNGFDVSNASVPAAQILPGGPPKDGIPSIDNPHFVDAESADDLSGDDRVIGVVHGDDARAYPIAIMNWHEIVNDEIGGESIVVSYCPLCGTGMVFEAPEGRSFGVSGLLYNSDVLMYDRQTESLWSQIKMEAVSGPAVGERLKLLPARHTIWADWRERHPDTQVLARPGGYRRDYDRDPYEGYRDSAKLYFPVDSRDRRYHPKEKVIGVSLDEGAAVWPFSELARAGDVVEDTIAGREVTVRFDSSARTATVFDEAGNEIPSTIAYWFAWMSFYPESKVFTAP
ncbi:MAG: DUF3179 domain-containing protein [Halioglobus sp.]|nr:DUF3179 domain-containing protein [Halioglobus sp.]